MALVHNPAPPYKTEPNQVQWRAVPFSEYERYYEVSDTGAVRYTPAHPSYRADKALLAVRLSTSGYPKVRLTGTEGVRRGWLVHHLVYAAFVGELPPRGGRHAKDSDSINHPLFGQEVMHLDDIHDNNFPHNLQLGTHSENIKMQGNARAFKEMSDAQLREMGR